jgi:hypothetical protein
MADIIMGLVCPVPLNAAGPAELIPENRTPKVYILVYSAACERIGSWTPSGERSPGTEEPDQETPTAKKLE